MVMVIDELFKYIYASKVGLQKNTLKNPFKNVKYFYKLEKKALQGARPAVSRDFLTT